MSPTSGLTRLQGARIVVVGDLIVDQYVRGNVERVSQEAPVPILRASEERYLAGGAANVAANAATLGGSVTLIGTIGADVAGEKLMDILEAYESITSRLTRVVGRPTTIKTRYLGGNHQILRVDREETGCLDDAAESQIIAALADALEGAGALVLSDYGKGVLSDRVIAAAFEMGRSAGIPVLVDPKRMNFAHYRGATIITPNRKELSAATGLACNTNEEAGMAAKVAMEASGAAILLTRSELGMSYFESGRPAIHNLAKAREVADVSGAGDTAVGTFALALAGGFEIANALRLANTAAGLAVGKYGTATVSWNELEAAVQGDRAAEEASVVLEDHDAAIERCTRWKGAGLTIGFANGCFDLLHPGHVRLLQAAAAACDRLVVALNSDASARRLKGEERPFQTQLARAQVVASIKGVSLVTLFEEDTPMLLIEKLRPDVIVKGSDYREDQIVGGEFVRGYGGSILLVDLEQGHSTTAIAERARVRLN